MEVIQSNLPFTLRLSLYSTWLGWLGLAHCKGWLSHSFPGFPGFPSVSVFKLSQTFRLNLLRHNVFLLSLVFTILINYSISCFSFYYSSMGYPLQEIYETFLSFITVRFSNYIICETAVDLKRNIKIFLIYLKIYHWKSIFHFLKLLIHEKFIVDFMT